MRMHKIPYILFIVFILFDLVTSILCFQARGLIEGNLLYQIIGMWAFPVVLFIDALILLSVEFLRKYVRWSSLILLIPTLTSMKACFINLCVLI